MENITKEAAIEHIYQSMPYSSQIKNLDISSESDAIRFSWRGNRFRVNLSYKYGVDEVGEGVLTGSDIAILVAHLLNESSH